MDMIKFMKLRWRMDMISVDVNKKDEHDKVYEVNLKDGHDKSYEVNLKDEHDKCWC